MKVAVGFSGWDRGFKPDKWTDDNRECHFEERNEHGTVYVWGQAVNEGELADRKIIYV